MLTAVIPFLRCPHCGEGFVADGGSLRCSLGHVFDIARQGYVSLIPGRGRVHHGDSAEMVSAREAFLGAGHLAGLRDATAATAADAIAPDSPPAAVVDAGAGTGYYLAGVLDRLPRHVGIALEASGFALRRAARVHARAGAVGCDVWGRLPLADACAALVLDIFAPRNGPEFCRILRSDGRLIVVTPTPDHLMELVGPLGLISVDRQKQQRLESELSPGFALVGSETYEQVMLLTGAELTALVNIGPSAHHLQTAELSRRVDRLLEGKPYGPPTGSPARAAPPSSSRQTGGAKVSVTASVLISVYRKSEEAAEE